MPSRRLFVAAALATSALGGGARAQKSAERAGPVRLGVDRALAYGLKYPTGFKDTHLQRV
jgi:hypothetical protein